MQYAHCLGLSRNGLPGDKITYSHNLDHLSMDTKSPYLPDELWEKILLHLYPRDLITKQGICKQVKNAIHGTPSLRRLLFNPAEPRQISKSVIRTILYRSSNRHKCIHETNQKSLLKLWTVGFPASKRSTWALRIPGQKSTDEFWTSPLFLKLHDGEVASNSFNSQHSLQDLVEHHRPSSITFSGQSSTENITLPLQFYKSFVAHSVFEQWFHIANMLYLTTLALPTTLLGDKCTFRTLLACMWRSSRPRRMLALALELHSS